jgi:hypothetical protein
VYLSVEGCGKNWEGSDADAAGIAENPNQNRKLSTIGNAHPLQKKNAKDGPSGGVGDAGRIKRLGQRPSE